MADATHPKQANITLKELDAALKADQPSKVRKRLEAVK
jgi:hypothetical protein